MIESSTSGSRLHSNLSSKEGTPIETTAKNTPLVSSSQPTITSGPHSRDQRSRFEKAGGNRKNVNDSKTHEDSVNGTAA